jgi:hypothetical protein
VYDKLPLRSEIHQKLLLFLHANLAVVSDGYRALIDSYKHTEWVSSRAGLCVHARYRGISYTEEQMVTGTDRRCDCGVPEYPGCGTCEGLGNYTILAQSLPVGMPIGVIHICRLVCGGEVVVYA